jgi:hypothetical protein
MKMIAGFMVGVVVCLLSILTISGQSQAADASTSTYDTGLASLMPDITGIYQNALALPYQQVQKEITDPSIAAFFAKYMEATGLDKVGGP